MRARVVAHVRCVEADVLAALETPVYGLNLFYGTSAELRAYSHGRRIKQMIAEAVPLIRRIRAAGRYVRFSAEDAFRSDLVDLLRVFDAVVEATEEAAFNAAVAADTVEGRDGNTLYGFPLDRGLAHLTRR